MPIGPPEHNFKFIIQEDQTVQLRSIDDQKDCPQANKHLFWLKIAADINLSQCCSRHAGIPADVSECCERLTVISSEACIVESRQRCRQAGSWAATAASSLRIRAWTCSDSFFCCSGSSAERPSM